MFHCLFSSNRIFCQPYKAINVTVFLILQRLVKIRRSILDFHFRFKNDMNMVLVPCFFLFNAVRNMRKIFSRWSDKNIFPFFATVESLYLKTTNWTKYFCSSYWYFDSVKIFKNISSLWSAIDVAYWCFISLWNTNPFYTKTFSFPQPKIILVAWKINLHLSN